MDNMLDDKGAGRNGGPVTEADLHGYVDGQLDDTRKAQVDAWLDRHPQERARVHAWQRQSQWLRTHLDRVLDEPLPLRLALPRRASRPWGIALAAGIALVALSAALTWQARGYWDARQFQGGIVLAGDDAGLARRAAVAHLVFAADQGRPVEVAADHEQAMVKWLSRRLGEPLRVPVLLDVGYALVGGRVLPGERGAVAQLMYSGAQGQRLTLYVTREAQGDPAAFRFAQEGPVRVFYWKDGTLGYALSGEVARDELWKVCVSVYRQLEMAQAGPTAG